MRKRVIEVASRLAKPVRGLLTVVGCTLTPLFPPGAEDVPLVPTV